MNQFLAHGQFYIRTEGQCLYTQMLGVWNKEGTERYSQAVKNQAQRMLSSPWARIVDLAEFEGGGSEVTAELTRLQRWAKDNSCIYVVFILPKSLVEYMLQSAHDVYQPFEIVQSKQEAEILAQQQLQQYTVI
ncbi:hypothetical protein DXX93_15635 [Thalassotalea euphylliae]|uniref:STAS/SEC14 domain-containing protein n=1 Tax=Thalassotalea euphylliae TaxID=1655234 RepID=A0A3E0TTI3_9GAMM|nr:hypothetical protein [Thalassotalea euphylliae]REL27848.1 hypothetical protein DXX93_15635 [Thalassotalea euphylliae]